MLWGGIVTPQHTVAGRGDRRQLIADRLYQGFLLTQRLVYS
jgi:hypothetical protein